MEDESPPPVGVMASQILERAQPNTKIGPPAEKLTIRLVSIGSTPSVSPNVLTVSGDRTISAVVQYLKKRLRSQSIHVYIQNTFEPAPSELIYDLFNLFGTKNELIVSYCLQVAFG